VCSATNSKQKLYDDTCSEENIKKWNMNTQHSEEKQMFTIDVVEVGCGVLR
jgi:hypothetical protein